LKRKSSPGSSSVEVLVNGEVKISLTPLDDETSLLMRYASTLKKLPSQFSVKTSIPSTSNQDLGKIKRTVPITVLSLEDELSTIRLEQLGDPGVISKLSILFPKATMEEIVYEWITLKGMPTDVAPLR